MKPLSYYTINPNNKLASLQKHKDEPIWCLIKSDNDWVIEKILRKVENEDNFILMASNGDNYIIQKSKIDEQISCFSSATIFLSNCNHYFFKNRYELFY